MRSQLGEAVLAEVIQLQWSICPNSAYRNASSFSALLSLLSKAYKAVDIGIEGMVDYCINRRVSLVLVGGGHVTKVPFLPWAQIIIISWSITLLFLDFFHIYLIFTYFLDFSFPIS